MAATAGINYISGLIGQKPGWEDINAGLLTGMAGKLILPYGFSRDPKKGCGSCNPFARILGYGSAKRYRYDVSKTAGLKKQKKRFDFGEFFAAAAFGGA